MLDSFTARQVNLAINESSPDNLYVILGGSGFLGLSISAVLDAHGYTWLNLDVDGGNSAKIWPENFVNVNSDKFITKISQDFRPKILINLAAPTTHLSNVQRQNDGLDKTKFKLGAREIALFHLVEQLFEIGIERYLFTSSIDVYGQSFIDSSYIDEYSELKPNTSYGESKRLLEEMYSDLCNRFVTSYSCIRLGHIYGPFEHLYYTRLLPYLYTLQPKSQVKLQLPSDFRRQYIYSLDIARFIVFLVKNKFDGIFNFVGDSVDYSQVCQVFKNSINLNISNEVTPSLDSYSALIGTEYEYIRSFPKIDFELGIQHCVNTINLCGVYGLRSRISL